MEAGRSADQCRLCRIQLRRDPVDCVGHSRQFVTDAVIERKFTCHLPFIGHEEAVTPLSGAAAHFRSRRREGGRCAEDEVGRCVAGERPVERERAARAVDRGPSRGQPAEFHSRHDVVRVMIPADLFGKLRGGIVLIPVRRAVGQSVETGDAEVGDAGVVVDGVSVKTCDSQAGAGVGLARHGERIQRRGGEKVASHAQVVHQVRCESVGVAHGEIRVGHRRGGGVNGDGAAAEDALILVMSASV